MNSLPHKILCLSFFLLAAFLFSACSTSKRFVKISKTYILSNSVPIKVLLSDQANAASITIQDPVALYKNNNAIAIIRKGNILNFYIEGNMLVLKITDKIFEADYFELKPAEGESSISYKGKNYRGSLKIVKDGISLKIINQVPLEDYLKGVIPAEMPVSADDSYLQALKAFAICARTYAINRLHNNPVFDIYADTRDQIYGGVGVQKNLSDQAVDETNGLILAYDSKPAAVFYHSSCGGHTENANNVFGIKNIPYLEGVQDGDPPNCSISQNFSWVEKYSERIFISRLKASGLLDTNNYSLKNSEIQNRDESGRVSLLVITLLSDNGDEKIINLEENRIRSVIRTANNSDILKSTLFDISIDDDKTVTINGKGFGHGVGLCQWGAIHQSMEGKDFEDILSFYFPGTEVNSLK